MWNKMQKNNIYKVAYCFWRQKSTASLSERIGRIKANIIFPATKRGMNKIKWMNHGKIEAISVPDERRIKKIENCWQREN